ncbi:HCP-like protein [Aaosphaeria arxii CBS 175.79]|uniref:HCP-like protein n=1 Tax=Aaosphaeria arxii CBS 175.79 TaxID=1450172 RepID=A0A6A5XJF0_9PLEO|nr:HCP-like protein [Aaosphaeria arxii CBS 175.79]KAF2013262.1 HCP-like protein [Aaosphaeria arxii CBS 175.79]
MPLRDLLKKRDKIKTEGTASSDHSGPPLSPDVPEFTFMRTTTNTQERIEPPNYPGDPTRQQPLLSPDSHKSFGRFRRSSNASQTQSGGDEHRGKGDNMLSGFRRSRSSSSVNVPGNLPAVNEGVARNEDDEAKWEKRATIMVQGSVLSQSGSTTPVHEGGNATSQRARSRSISEPSGDTNIQEAIRLHESGNLEASTKLFAKLADPNGENNALSQVLYGLALRHGWGCEKNLEQAVTYLNLAASNSANIEALALSAGMKKGGAAKGELVLAMYELANCFRNGWGIKKDPVAAKQYYETAANLGDTDAMNEVAWCYLEGFGCKKDKFKAAQFLRLSEEKGNKQLGNTW